MTTSSGRRRCRRRGRLHRPRRHRDQRARAGRRGRARRGRHDRLGRRRRSARVRDHLADRPGVGVLIAPNFALGAVLAMAFAAPRCRLVRVRRGRRAAPPGQGRRTVGHRDAHRRARSPPRAPPRASGPSPDATTQALDGARGRGRRRRARCTPSGCAGLVAHEEILLGNPGEQLTIRHDSFDRVSFMPGVLLAVRQVAAASRPHRRPRAPARPRLTWPPRRARRRTAVAGAVTLTALLGASTSGSSRLRAIALIGTGKAVGIVLGVAFLVLPLVVVWLIVREWLLAIDVQRMADELAAADELPVDDLPRSPGGRIDRAAARDAFETARDGRRGGARRLARPGTTWRSRTTRRGTGDAHGPRCGPPAGSTGARAATRTSRSARSRPTSGAR